MERGGTSNSDLSGPTEEGRCACGLSLNMMGIHVAPTTGGHFELRVASTDTVEFLRRLVSKKLRVPKERICLLFKDRHLRNGTMEDNSILDGARITLLPSVETGLLAQRPEQSVMQALESLNDGQLQLSTVSPGSSRKNKMPSHYHSHQDPSHFSPSYSGPGISQQPTPTSLSAPSHMSSTSVVNLSQSNPSSRMHHHHHLYHHHVGTSSPPPSSLASYLGTPPHHHHYHHHHYHRPVGTPGSPIPSSPCSSSSVSPAGSPAFSSVETDMPVRGCPHRGDEVDHRASLDTRALAEASRNLTQTLKQLSSEVLTTKPLDKESSGDLSSPPSPVNSAEVEHTIHDAVGCSLSSKSDSVKRQGAIIESMHHHGKGVYSGTFSGTLNPALQDRQGRPKRDISTIIHILNDLLCATPQYRRPNPSSGHSKRRSHEEVISNKRIKIDRQNLSSTNSQNVSVRECKETDTRAKEDRVIRSKMEQIRLKMQEKKARQQARRAARESPITSSASLVSNTPPTTTWSSDTTVVASGADTTTGKENGGNSEGNDPSALCKLSSGTIVA